MYMHRANELRSAVGNVHSAVGNVHSAVVNVRSAVRNINQIPVVSKFNSPYL